MANRRAVVRQPHQRADRAMGAVEAVSATVVAGCERLAAPWTGEHVFDTLD